MVGYDYLYRGDLNVRSLYSGIYYTYSDATLFVSHYLCGVKVQWFRSLSFDFILERKWRYSQLN